MVRTLEKGLYDIHNHILPGVDDGSEDLKMSMELIDMEYKSGVRNIIFTPHYIARSMVEKCRKMSDDMEEAFEKVKRECEKIHPDMRLKLGNELFYSDRIIEELNSGRAHIMGKNDKGNRYILTEFNTDIRHQDMKKAISRYQMSGYRPIIAHVERYDCLYKEYDIMDELKESGVMFQMNTENFLEGIFSSNKKYCLNLIRNGYIELISTDTHNKTTRRPDMEEAVAYLSKKTDGKILQKILYENPSAIFDS